MIKTVEIIDQIIEIIMQLHWIKLYLYFKINIDKIEQNGTDNNDNIAYIVKSHKVNEKTDKTFAWESIIEKIIIK